MKILKFYFVKSQERGRKELGVEGGKREQQEKIKIKKKKKF